MSAEIFEYKDYKKYLRDRLEGQSETKGARQKLSRRIGCQPSYLSQVLNGKPHLTLEHGSRVNQFFGHSKEESRYFILMLEFERAGTRELKDFFLEQMNEFRQERLNLKKRLTQTADIPRDDQSTYYSAWYYLAIHVILSIPTFHDPLRIAKHFNLPTDLVSEVIRFLERSGLVEREKSAYKLTNRSTFLGRDSEFIRRHHINWRSQALQSAEKNLSDDMHYSNVTAISNEDFGRIKELFAQAIENARKILLPSKEEALFAITLDVFRL